MATQKILVPDIGASSDVAVIELLVKEGDKIEKDQSLVTLESDKASMEVPAPFAGVIKSIKVKVGDKVSEGSLLFEAESESQVVEKTPEKPVEIAISAEPVEKLVDVKIPDIGGSKDVAVIEIAVKVGDVLQKDQTMMTLESDKASMEIPSPYAGTVKEVLIKVGDKVSEGALVLKMMTKEVSSAPIKQETKSVAEKFTTAAPQEIKPTTSTPVISNADVHAGPAVRRLAYELGVDLKQVKGTGRKERIQLTDIHAFVKSALKERSSGGFAIPAAPQIDFSKFGEIETKALTKIKKLTGVNTHRSWVTIPHVTQFDEADITDMEDFRLAHKEEAEKKGFKLTPLVFLMKSVVACLKEFPIFNSSLDSSGENLIMKKYFHIGVAMDTPNGLVVGVVRDVDQKGLYELAGELSTLSKKAREKGLSINEMQGSCFTISSLGGIGGTAFTPIVNAPDVAILGVSKSSIKPVYIDKQFVPRLMLPLSLSYDHRVIDGADAARFITFLSKELGDVRQLLF